MPTFKHPCPACGKFIARDVARCPFCGSVDPFVPGRCPKCRAPIEDAAWIACAKCGTPLNEGVAPMPGATPAVATPGTVAGTPAPVRSALPADAPPSAPTPAAPPAPQGPSRLACSGCGAALAPGASFCTVCGTLAP
jgi:RNA polymerase subunit RPABC4/transcription elongation factor Spt4